MTDGLSRTAQLARDLIRFDTQNWGGGRSSGEADAAAYVAEVLASMGVESQTLESAPGRASVIARIDGTDPSLPLLVVHGHLDVVPADASEWSVDPFAGEIRDGCLWGRGAVDMKQMDAMILAALERILAAGRRPRRGLVIAFFADEEAGGEYGAHWLVREHPELFAGATEAISEVGGYSVEIAGTRAYLLQTAEKALQWILLRARGTAAHGSQHMRDNAVTKLARAVADVGAHEFPVELTDTTRALIAGVAELLGVEDDDPDAVAERTGTISRFLRSSLRHTANPTMLEAGYKHNVIPSVAEARIDVRPLPGREAEAIDAIKAVVGDDIEVELVHGDVGIEHSYSGELVEAMAAALTRHDPEARVLPYMLSGGTDNKSLSELGIAGYGFAPLKLTPELDFAAMFHGVDERVPLTALDFGTDVLEDLLLTY
ncbi:M20/M25/M40 family metallo-hydrolase [Agrococcus jenensis]|uniref:Acetylornithine deacetylase/succinyl-diaminopimelate desuccinylase-like protein n=1 Tax=Agrococcus jenensis TaxID=46353 RepID=A0A3N2AVA3_9MICO|nr:M20/M25/M40 family metallo-hydrolase [Agrococcus jenensis]ROR66959.1 acetylornithine deacetylase/succinyl-diaminopimelate desuccinylase-like protein [Agrococcus jenensis]